MPAKKKILVFIDWYLPGYRAGGPIQSCANLVDHLSTEFDFYIVTRDTDYCETKPYEGIVSDAWNTLNNGTQVYYVSTALLNRAFIKKICTETAFDYVYINGVYSFYFSILPLFYLRNVVAKRIVVATRGMLAESAIAVKKTKKSVFLQVSKRLGLFKRVTFQASTVAEVSDIKRVMGKESKIVLAANLPKKTVPQSFSKRDKDEGSIKLVNIARIAPEKNLKFALEVLREVKANVTFDFYGPIYAEAYYEECKLLIAQMPSNIMVTYKDSIESSKVNEVFQSYHALFMPTLGENFGHIILESLVAGSPVLISDQTPWKDLQSRSLGFDVSLSDKASFVNAIEQMAALDGDEFAKWSLASYNFGKEFVNNPEVLKQNLNLFEVNT